MEVDKEKSQNFRTQGERNQSRKDKKQSASGRTSQETRPDTP